MSIAYIALLVYFSCVDCVPLIIEQFSSQSFVPDDIKVAYSIEQQMRVDYNLTIEEPFAGKILMNVFVRRLPEVGSTALSKSFIKFRNLDFCKALESLRNLTIDRVRGVHLIPKTFLTSCPLIPGFYYVKSAMIDFNVLPANIDDGRYLVIMELIQVYEEVTLLINVKAKCSKHTPEGVTEKPFRFDSNEDVGKAEEEAADDDTSNEHKNNQEGTDNENDDEAKNASEEEEVLEGDDVADNQSGNEEAEEAEAEAPSSHKSEEEQQEEDESKQGEAEDVEEENEKEEEKEEEEQSNNDKGSDNEEEEDVEKNVDADYQDNEKQEVFVDE